MIIGLLIKNHGKLIQLSLHFGEYLLLNTNPPITDYRSPFTALTSPSAAVKRQVSIAERSAKYSWYRLPKVTRSRRAASKVPLSPIRSSHASRTAKLPPSLAVM